MNAGLPLLALEVIALDRCLQTLQVWCSLARLNNYCAPVYTDICSGLSVWVWAVDKNQIVMTWQLYTFFLLSSVDALMVL